MVSEPVLLVNLPVNQSVNFQFLGNFNFHARVFHPKSLQFFISRLSSVGGPLWEEACETPLANIHHPAECVANPLLLSRNILK